jgi:hypothetical protein
MWHERRDTQTGVWWENLKGRNHLKDLGADGVFQMILKKQAGNAKAALMWLSSGKVVGFCAHGNGLSGSIKCGEFLD